MDLKIFIEEALVDIVDAVEGAQKQLLYGEIVPDREAKPGEANRTGDADIEFEITVKPEEREGQRPKLIVVTGAASVKPSNAAPPPSGSGSPPSGAPPPPPPGKLKFKVPVRLPRRRGCFLSRWIEYLAARRRRRKTVFQPKTEAAAGEKDEKKKSAESRRPPED